MQGMTSDTIPPAGFAVTLKDAAWATYVFVVIGVGVFLAVQRHAWWPLYQMTAPALGLFVLVGGRRPRTVLAIACLVVSSLVCLAVVESLVWSHLDAPLFVTYDYRARYTATDHRLFKEMCRSRSKTASIFAKSVGGTTFARCGAWYPQVITIAAASEAYDQARASTANDAPGAPITIERPAR
jgi:hypothetical protein